ncbi:MAG: 6-carboxytetrahydropterin synthase, partial [Candidatus Eremiobacteraeota bacterium]|nr:6-carboxytetrahydropterin synthase [Candidatus Eremiobacteraeota bacterium]
CARPHGHSYRLDVALRGRVQGDGPAAGMVDDFEAIEELVQRTIVDVVDHRSLNDFVDNPTCELILEWMWSRLHPLLPRLDELVLWETASSCAVLRADDKAK